jgi:hypothetical protein
MKSDFLTDFWKGFIVALGFSGSISIYRVDKVKLDKIKRMLLISSLAFAIISTVKLFI